MAVALAAPGCGGRPGMVDIVGAVTYQGQPPPAAGVVFFAPIEDFSGTGGRPATAEFGPDGKFRVNSFGEHDGLKPGRYRVTVQIWKERPQGYLKPGVNLVPADYPLEELVVEAGATRVEVTYDISPPESR